MNKVIFPLKPRMKSATVGDLQDAILNLLVRSLLLAIDESQREKLTKKLLQERGEQFYGNTTTLVVTIFQREQNIEPTGSVDKATAALLNALLADEEKSDITEQIFTVSGQAKDEAGKIIKRQSLLAFDIDLRGVAIYRDVKSVKNLNTENGFENLNQAVSDSKGSYEFTFNDSQFTLAERKKADVIVFAHDGDNIIGRSHIIRSEAYSRTGLVSELDVIVTEDNKQTEYEILMAELTTFLKESRTTLAEISPSRDQLEFTASELDIEQTHINIAANAELLLKKGEKGLSHELFYGTGRQEIKLTWHALYKKSEEELRQAIQKSINDRIIGEYEEKTITLFLQAIRENAVKHMLYEIEADDGNTLSTMLSYALPEEQQRFSFVNALSTFKGGDFREFWDKHLPAQPEFQENPALVKQLLLTQQLTLLTGNHQALVKEFQLNRKLKIVPDLIKLEKSDWLAIIKITGVPEFIEGISDEEKFDKYYSNIQGLLNSAFPTQRIVRMLEKNELPIKELSVARNISVFLAKNENFNIASSRIHDFDEEIKVTSGEEHEKVRAELMKLQRVFQVSTTPEVMPVLMDNNLHSAYTIANIPRKSFINTYGNALGDERTAFAIHERASFISTRAEMSAMHIKEYTNGPTLPSLMGESESIEVSAVLEKNLPNYAEMFGSPDMCECKHCRSVYSPAAYFVDLLRFLWRSEPNDETPSQTPLDILSARRPDLLHLPLTCENTNTVIPYIDLANEVMEHYVANDSLINFSGHNTGEATADELRANPQHTNVKAYQTLSEANYPFTLPYHQPLDVIRTYSDNLGVSRYQVLKAMNPQADAETIRAIEAEALNLSPQDYTILTGEAFDGTPDPTSLHSFYGYAATTDLGNLSAVREFLQRSGIVYTDLVELIKTNFINPHQRTFDFIEKIGSHAAINTNELYSRLKRIEAGTLDPSTDVELTDALNAYNMENDNVILMTEFSQWVIDHFSQFQQIITLYEPQSKCNLDTTRLRTIESIYEGLSTSGIANSANGPWSKFHRFIRLWKKLDWSIHETDLMLSALGEDSISSATIHKLESVSLLKTASKRPLNHLAVLWGDIGTIGKKSLYKKIFLNKAVQQIDKAFKADAWGDYLQDTAAILAEHQSTILAAYRIREDDLDAILKVAQVVDGGNPRHLDKDTDILNLQNLSVIYRHVILAKALKMRVTDLCTLIGLFNQSPFSLWIQQDKYTNISPQETYRFYELVATTKSAGFKPSVLKYIFQGGVSADSTIGLDKEKTLQTARVIRDALTTIEQDHPDTPDLVLTTAAIEAKLSLTFQPEVVSRFMEIVNGSASFSAITDDNLAITIPDSLANKYTYIKGSGRIVTSGVMTDADRLALTGLANASTDFTATIDALYLAPETFIHDNFKGIFNDIVEAQARLLNHPAQANAAELDEKLAYIYMHFLPLLKKKLRENAVTQHISTHIGLSEDMTVLLIAGDIDALVEDLAIQGFSATYFNSINWSNPALERVDNTIDFFWADASPDTLVSADNFCARWSAYIATPTSGKYTFVVDVKEDDEAFKLYLDGTLVLEKQAGNNNTSWEVIVDLNATKMHLLTLEYAETLQQAGITFRWKTATSAPEIVPSSIVYPAILLDTFVEKITVLHRAVRFILGFKINATEVGHFITFNSDFGNINFKALTWTHWQRIYAYANMRNNIPQTQALLTEVFTQANTINPTPSIDQLIERLHFASSWDRENLNYLVKIHFNLSVDDFKNERAIKWLYDVMKIVTKSGLSAATVAEWASATVIFNDLHDIAQLMKDTVKAKYGEDDWLDLAANLNNGIRENQQQALVNYLLMHENIKAANVVDADGLFEYFLIDVQMTACMETSRIVQANAAIQLFVNRCFLNLESNLSANLQTGISPAFIDKERWQWMKNYRVWEANRKIFLYPENWLEPEWRNDRSEFFKDLESYLVQNDMTDRNVEQGFRNYLSSLNEVANLEVCGMHRENHNDGKLKFLHVVARTHNTPYKFFYRRWNEHMKWSAWEKVQLDIRSVEGGEHGGVHLIPVVWKNRLFLFWPEFMKIPQQHSANKNKSVSQISTAPLRELEPVENWEIKLAWSERVNEKWSVKQLSKEFTSLPADVTYLAPKALLFTAKVNSTTQNLVITMTSIANNIKTGQEFIFSDIQSKVQLSASFLPDLHSQFIEGNYYIAFSSRARWYAHLELLDDVYLYTTVRNHKLLPINKMLGTKITLNDPLFFSDADRTYFVRPNKDRVVEVVKTPAANKPISMSIIQKSLYPIETELSAMSSNDSASIGAISTASNDTALPISKNLNNYQMRSSKINDAFGTTLDKGYGEMSLLPSQIDKGLEFHTFYHPFSSEYVSRINQDGIVSLMKSNTDIPSDQGATFGTYAPNILSGLVKNRSNFSAPPSQRTAYQENICFDVYGANSLYNWELFFHAPLYIATRLSRNGKYEDAMKWFHCIFDPTTDEIPGNGESEVSRYWKVLPFKTTEGTRLEEWFSGLSPNTNPNNPGNAIISEWRNNPFDTHLVASNRPIAYMKHVVIKYVENLINWSDSLFRQFTRESIYEALQLYVIANHVLGPRPEVVPKRGTIKAETYSSLQYKWDDFSNALVELENSFPFSSEVNTSNPSPGTSLLGIGSALYFCIPNNEKLLEYWDIVADRLYKIRHCQDIEGVERTLALFAPPIDPAMLVRAASQGLSLDTILGDLNSPPPIYRFTYLIQKANEFCNDVEALGSAVLSALEKKDAEKLSRMRISHEANMLELITGIRKRQIMDAKVNRENLLKSREATSFRMQKYLGLIGGIAVTIPSVPEFKAGDVLPGDTIIATVQTDVDTSPVESNDSNVKLIPKEKEALDKSNDSMISQQVATSMEGLAGVMNALPNLELNVEPLGMGTTLNFGGSHLGAATSALAKVPQIFSQVYAYEAAQAATMAIYIRREQDWTLQANLAAKEIIQLDKQITSADIRIQIAKKELENHDQQIKNAKDIELFLKDKFTNQELYQWMKEQLFSVYKQSYFLAFDMAKEAERAYQYELGTETTNFIHFGYWDGSKQGLVSGEKLQLALRQLEKSYLGKNRRDLELLKNVSLALLNPLALIELRETGKCQLSLPEELFDLDFQGHYFRRIKSVSLSIPCVAGSHTTVNCSLHLIKNTTRIKTSMNSEGSYEHENDEGVWIDDVRFRRSNVPVTSIATSRAQNDPGMFEFNFRDERYLPFEGAGAISTWHIELTTEKELRQFDYSTISDVIMHVNYRARENGGLFKREAIEYIKKFITNEAELSEQPLMQMFSMRHEFPTEWRRFLVPSVAGAEQKLSFTLGKQRFPFFIQDNTIIVMKIDILAKCQKDGDYHMILSTTNFNEDLVISSEITAPKNNNYGELNVATLNETDAGLTLEEVDITKEMSLRIKHNVSSDYTNLTSSPDEVEDLFIVAHYKMERLS